MPSIKNIFVVAVAALASFVSAVPLGLAAGVSDVQPVRRSSLSTYGEALQVRGLEARAPVAVERDGTIDPLTKALNELVTGLEAALHEISTFDVHFHSFTVELTLLATQLNSPTVR
jgi:hypothetical protein